MYHIKKINKQKVAKFNLFISLNKNEYNYNIVGILKKDKKIVEYCETINIANSDKASKIYDVLNKNKVFPSHFYNIIDDF